MDSVEIEKKGCRARPSRSLPLHTGRLGCPRSRLPPSLLSLLSLSPAGQQERRALEGRTVARSRTPAVLRRVTVVRVADKVRNKAQHGPLCGVCVLPLVPWTAWLAVTVTVERGVRDVGCCLSVVGCESCVCDMLHDGSGAPRRTTLHDPTRHEARREGAWTQARCRWEVHRSSDVAVGRRANRITVFRNSIIICNCIQYVVSA